MKTYQKIVWDMESLQIIKRIIRCADYHGPVNKCCGATGGQKEALAQEQKVSQLLTTNFRDFAGENKNILEHLVQSLSPISSAGPSQFGLAPAAEAAERTTTAEQLSAAGQNAANAVRSTLASRGGGTTYLPSGSEASIIGSLQDTATKEALTQADITKQGCDIGRQNWLAATQELAAAPGALEVPVTGAGGAAIGQQAKQCRERPTLPKLIKLGWLRLAELSEPSLKAQQWERLAEGVSVQAVGEQQVQVDDEPGTAKTENCVAAFAKEPRRER
jgi:hypothetical protein